MGKNKNKKEKQAEKAAAAEQQAAPVKEAAPVTPPQVATQETTQEPVPVVPEVTTTPQERVDEYQSQQKNTWDAVMDGFKADDLMLQSEADFSNKIDELAKTKATELKKFEKGNKLAVLEFDDLFAQCHTDKTLAQLNDRALKTLTTLCRTAAKKCAQNQQPAQHILTQVEDIKGDITANMKKRKTLQFMSELLLKKNADLYLKHETMLDDERQKRIDLGASFQGRMAVIQEELTQQKEVRAAQMEENNAIRAKIQAAISEYNVKEQDYQTKMKTYQTQMQGLESKFKSQIEGKIQKQLVVAKQAKDSYDQAVNSCEDLANKIKGIVEKFDTIKEEINNSSKKMEEYKENVEQNQMEIKLLETEIENLTVSQNKKAGLQMEIDTEGSKLKKQVETLSNLKKALQTQLSNA